MVKSFQGHSEVKSAQNGWKYFCCFWMCWSNNVISTILKSFDLAMTFRWPHHDLGITPLWNPTPTHVTISTWLGFRAIYFHTTLRVKGTLTVKGTILRWPLVTLSMHRKSADQLVYKNTHGGGGRFSTFSPWSILTLSEGLPVILVK